MKFSPTLPRTEAFYVRDYITIRRRDAGVMKGADTLRAKLDEQSS